MAMQIFEKAACKIPHFDQSGIVQTVKRPNGVLRRCSGAACDMRQVEGTCYINTPVNRMDPRRA